MADTAAKEKAQKRDPDHKVDWPWFAPIWAGGTIVTFVLAVIIAFPSLAAFDAVMARNGYAFAGFIAVVVVGYLFWLSRHWVKRRRLPKDHLTKLRKATPWILGYVGVGFLTAAVLLVQNHHHPTSSLGNIVFWPIAILASSSPALVGLVVLVIGLVWAGVLYESGIAHGKDGKVGGRDMAQNVKGVIGVDRGDKVPAKKPDAGYVSFIDADVKNLLVTPEQRPGRVVFGQASLASDWNKYPREMELALPHGESLMVAGLPGAGKGVMIQRMVLALERRKEGAQPTKLAFISTATLDIPKYVVPWLRNQDYSVDFWDLSGNIKPDDATHGDQGNWAPQLGCIDADAAKKMANYLIDSAETTEQSGAPWKSSVSQILAPLLRCANMHSDTLDGYAWVLSAMTQWDNPGFVEPQIMLQDADETVMLDSWIGVRNMVMQRNRETGEWEHKLSDSKTGDSVQFSARNVVHELRNEAVLRATSNPTLNIHEWLRTEGDACLLMTAPGNQKALQAMLSPAIEELIDGAVTYSKEDPLKDYSESLPYRLIIIIDEFTNFPAIRAMVEHANQVRKSNIQLILLFQSYAHLALRYGNLEQRAMRTAFQNSILLGPPNDDETISFMMRLAGNQHTELGDNNQTTQISLLDGSDFLSLKTAKRTKGQPDQVATGYLFATAADRPTKISNPYWDTLPDYTDRGSESLGPDGHPKTPSDSDSHDGTPTVADKVRSWYRGRKSTPEAPPAWKPTPIAPGPGTTTPEAAAATSHAPVSPLSDPLPTIPPVEADTTPSPPAPPDPPLLNDYDEDDYTDHDSHMSLPATLDRPNQRRLVEQWRDEAEEQRAFGEEEPSIFTPLSPAPDASTVVTNFPADEDSDEPDPPITLERYGTRFRLILPMDPDLVEMIGALPDLKFVESKKGKSWLCPVNAVSVTLLREWKMQGLVNVMPDTLLTPKDKIAPVAGPATGNKIYLKVPYDQKDKAKEMGARWDKSAKSWYVPKGMDLAPFKAWAKT